MTQPVSKPLRMYGNLTNHEVLDWSWAEERLTDSLFYWLTSASPVGKPCARVVWGRWFENRLLLTVGSPIHWRNVMPNPMVSVQVGDGLEVVVVEGRASAERDEDVQRRFLELYNPKYHYDLKAPTTMFAVEPDVVFAWYETGHAGNEGFVGSGKWVF